MTTIVYIFQQGNFINRNNLYSNIVHNSCPIGIISTRTTNSMICPMNIHETCNQSQVYLDRIHGETSYLRLAQRWSTAGAFWSSRGRIVAVNNMSAICPDSVVA